MKDTFIIITLVVCSVFAGMGKNRPLYIYHWSQLDINQVWLNWSDDNHVHQSRLLADDFTQYQCDPNHSRYKNKRFFELQEMVDSSGNPFTVPYYYLTRIEMQVDPACHPIYLEQQLETGPFKLGIVPDTMYKLLEETMYILGHNGWPTYRFEQILRNLSDKKLYVARPGQPTNCSDVICPFVGNATGNPDTNRYNNFPPQVTAYSIPGHSFFGAQRVTGKVKDSNIWDQYYHLKYRWKVMRTGKILLDWTPVPSTGETPLPQDKNPSGNLFYILKLEVTDGEAMSWKILLVRFARTPHIFPPP